MIRYFFFLSILLIILSTFSCNPSRNSGFFARKTIREKYEDKLEKDSGKNNLYINAWLEAGKLSLNNPLTITEPYEEYGRFSPGNLSANSLKVFVQRGKKLLVKLDKTSREDYTIYMDLWQVTDLNQPGKSTYIANADTLQNTLEYIASKDEYLIVRYQPQISTQYNYTIHISTGPSFVFPIAASVNSSIGSFWGAGRDGGARKHEGIDIFAPAKSPVVAVADGYITSVSENTLGGKVIFMNPDNSPYNVYYAHLDKQLASPGQQVKVGELIGLTGNTGNAKFTASHLHFGIYTDYGAIDPLAFIEKQRDVKRLPALQSLPDSMITKKETKIYTNLSGSQHTAILNKQLILKTEAYNGKYYRVILPGGQKAFAEIKNLAEIKDAKKNIKKR